jgi:hypothetical protein
MSFSINAQSLSDSASFAKTIHGDFYPSGKSPVLNTSASLAPPATGRTLSSFDVTGVMAGDVLNRSKKYPIAAMNASISASLNGLITGGAAAAAATTPENATISIPNPEATDFSVDGEGNPTGSNNATLTGAAAWNKILSKSMVGKNIGNTFVENSLQIIRNTMISSSQADDPSDNNRGSGGSGSPGIGEMQSAGRRDVALIAELTLEEKGWYQERLTLLRSKYESQISDVGSIGGFRFDIPNEWATDPRDVYNGSSTHFPDSKVDSSQRILSDDLILQSPTPGISNAFLSAALIELLILLHEKNYYITGGFGAGRNPNQPQYVKPDKFTPGDHTFGRAIDIRQVGRVNEESFNVETTNGTPNHVPVYGSALDILIEALSEVPQYLIPDSIVVSDKLDLGIVDGLEPVTAAIKLNRPYLQYLNFHADSNHRDHIHLSFSGMRAGKYVGPGGAMTISATNVTSRPSNLSGSADSLERQIEKQMRGGGYGGSGSSPADMLDANYYGQWDFSLGLEGVYDVLTQTWCSPELAACLAAVAVRESNCRPTGFYIGDDDFISLGFLQINMGAGGYKRYSETNKKYGRYDGLAHGTKTYELTNTTGKTQMQGWLIASANWNLVYPGETVPTQDTYNKMINDKYYLSLFYNGGVKNKVIEEMRPLVDRRVWIPRNQAWMAYTARTSKLPAFGDPKLDGYQFQVWGDGYKDYGWMNGGVKFQDAADIYSDRTGKTAADLKKWLRNVYKTDPSVFLPIVANSSAKYIERWMNGEVFPRNYANGDS